MRIIGGRWRGRRLPVIPVPNLRPTPDRARETLFNWIGTRIQGSSCLDLCAGTGVLGFEALSRDATVAHLVESNTKLVTALKRQAVELDAAERIHVHCADVLAWLRQCTENFDLAFLDPPYDCLHLLERCCDALATSTVLRHGGLLYLECLPECYAVPGGFRELRRARAGRVLYALLERTASA